MALEHIGRKQAIGIGKEGTSGTAVAATNWVQKLSGSFRPLVETAQDDGAAGIIDRVREVHTVKNMTEVQFSAVAKDVIIGHMLHALFGTSDPCVKFSIAGSITGTYVEGETITESTSLATGVLKRLDAGGSSKALYISVVTGTFTGGQILTGGTSGATATGGSIESPAAVRSHIFRRLNNNTHPSYTIYGSDPVSDDRAAYCMLDSLEFECVVGDMAKFTATFKGKQLGSTSAQTPTYTTEYPFLAKNASFKLASAFTGLDAASALGIERIMLRFPKNLTDITEFGSTSPTSLHNQDFGEITGEITLKYNAITHRDLVINSTKQAARLAITNPVTIGSGSNPTIQFDFPSIGFREFSRPSENSGIVKQTLSFTAEYDTTRALSVEALLQNTKATAF